MSEAAKARRIVQLFDEWYVDLFVPDITLIPLVQQAYEAGYAQAEADAAGRVIGKSE